MKISETGAKYKAPSKGASRVRIPDRVSVRLKPDLAQRLDELRRERGASVTELVEQALSEFIERQSRPPRMALLDALRQNGLLGTLDLGPDASKNYKELVAQSITEKYGHR